MFEDGRIWNWKPVGLEEAARRAEKRWIYSETERKRLAALRAEKEGKA